MKLMAYIICLSLVACGKTYQVGSDFTPVVDEFNKQANDKAATNLIVDFGETSNKSAGATCYHEHTPRIAVDQNTWNQMSSDSRREMLRHELGHCVLDREHTTDRFPEDKCPTSIMNASPVGEWCRNAHSEHYEQELFQ